MQTGWYGSPLRYTKVHVIDSDGPICGAKIGIDLSFQWCASGAEWDYIECKACKKKVLKIEQERCQKHKSEV